MIVNELPTKILAKVFNEESEELEEQVWDVLYITNTLTHTELGFPYEVEIVTCMRNGKTMRVQLDEVKIIKTRRVNYGQTIVSSSRANFTGKKSGK